MNTQDLLRPSNPSVDTFSFPRLAMPPSTCNDASVEVTPPEDIFNSPDSKEDFLVGLEGCGFAANSLGGRGPLLK